MCDLTERDRILLLDAIRASRLAISDNLDMNPQAPYRADWLEEKRQLAYVAAKLRRALPKTKLLDANGVTV